MNRPAPGWLTHLTAGSILILLGIVACPQAHACGRHSGGSLLRTIATEPAPAPERPLPCTGPVCSAPQSPPLVPLSSNVPSTEDDCCRLSEPSGTRSAPAPGWLATDDRSPISPLAESIFHPPR